MRPDTIRNLAGPERLEDRTTMDATGFIDIPTVRFIAEHARLQLHAELGAEVWTSWERFGTSGTAGILRSIGTNAGTSGNPDNPSAQDALALRFDQPITRPTTVKLWTEGIPPTNVYAWVNSAEWRIDAGANGTIRIDASPERPISTLSILASGGGRYGIDAFEIEGDKAIDEETPEVDAAIDTALDVLHEETWNQLSASLESAFDIERKDAEFRETYRRNNIDVAAVSLVALEPMLAAAQQSFATTDTQRTQATIAFRNAEAAWTPVHQRYVAADAQEKELYRVHVAATTKYERSRTAQTLTNFRYDVFYPIRTEEMALTTTMNAARTTMNNANGAHAQAEAKLHAVTEAFENARVFAARSYADSAELPTTPVEGEPAVPSMAAEAAEGKKYAGTPKMSSWIESKPYGYAMIVRYASPGNSTTFTIPAYREKMRAENVVS